MAHFPWDEVLVGMIMAGAVAYLLRGLVWKRSGGGGCGGGCNSCPSSASSQPTPEPPPLVQLDIRPRR